MAQKIIKIGKSTGVTIPKEILGEMKLKAGDTVTVAYDKKRSSLVIKQKDELSPRLERIAQLTHNFIERYRKDLEELAKK